MTTGLENSSPFAQAGTQKFVEKPANQCRWPDFTGHQDLAAARLDK